MKERLGKLVPSAAGDLTLGTFHAICARILRRDGHFTGVSPDFVIYDADDQEKLLKQAIAGAGFDTKQYSPGTVGSFISQAKSQMLSPGGFKERSRSYFEEVVARIYKRYERALGESKALDFDDLLLKTAMLFKTRFDVLERYRERYVHFMVDEFQDTNLVQYELVKLLSGKYRNLCVVGDPDESIYSWRSADLRNVLNFEKDFTDAKVVYLEQNYRSTVRILETARAIITPNVQRKDIKVWTENELGEPICVAETYNEQEEAQFVAQEIERLVETGQVRYNDCAVMYRTNAQSRVLEEAFVRRGMPYKLVAGTRFYERKEVKDLLAYLRLLQNAADSISLLRLSMFRRVA